MARSWFDDIVGFAELEKFIDMPVKRYSSGMYVRLGFAVAAHVEPEVLLVDEVLSVGDIAFQGKCTERMSQLIGGGTTVVMVSHNLGTIESFCSRCVVLEGGRTTYIGETQEALRRYLLSVDDGKSAYGNSPIAEGQAIESVETLDRGGRPRGEFSVGEDVCVRLRIDPRLAARRVQVAVGITDGRQGSLMVSTTITSGREEDCVLTCRFLSPPLKPRSYELWGQITSSEGVLHFVWQRIGSFRVEESSPRGAGDSVLMSRYYAPISIESQWTTSPPSVTGVRLAPDQEDPARRNAVEEAKRLA
jgi:hypothetical protein